MKILHIGKYYYPYHGGIESVVKNVCEGLVTQGHEVEVLCSNTKMKTEYDVINGVKVTRCSRLFTLFSQAIMLTMAFYIFKKARQYDLIHLHGPNPLAEFICLFLPKDIPIVVTYHSDVVRQKLLLPFYLPVLKKFLKRCAEIYVATENHIKYSIVLPEFEYKCRIIPFGIPVDHLEKTQEVEIAVNELKSKYGDYILTVGRLVKYKGFEYLIEAAKDFDQKVVIVGSGPDQKLLQEKIDEYGLTDQVTLVGRVDDDTMFSAYFHGCEVFTLPSITNNENFGIVQLEAMACDKPIVTTNLNSGVPCVGLKGETCLLVEPMNSDSLSKALQMLMNNSELRTKFSRAAKVRFNNLYTQEVMVYSHVEAYESLFNIDSITRKKKYKKSA